MHQSEMSSVNFGFGNFDDKATSMLVTDVWDEICWWQLLDVGDSFDHFGHQNQLSFYISVRHPLICFWTFPGNSGFFLDLILMDSQNPTFKFVVLQF